VVQAAAGHEMGLLLLNTLHSNGTTAALYDNFDTLANALTVPALPIDMLLHQKRKVDFIKIDVEGAEYNALLGARHTIERDHPTIVSEFSPGLLKGISGVTGAEYLQFLLGFGYRISIIEQDGGLSLCGSDVEKVMNAYVASGIDHIDLLLD
jgi:hypothetical protein